MPTRDDSKTTCLSCGETVRVDRTDAAGVCVNCLALGRARTDAGGREATHATDSAARGASSSSRRR